MKYAFSIPETEEEHNEILYDNMILFRVYDENDEDISAKCIYVIIYLTKNAKIGLGTELIRLAHNFEDGKEVHIVPSTKEKGPQESMGIYLTPDSCKLTIKCTPFPPIEECLKEWEQEHKAKQK